MEARTVSGERVETIVDPAMISLGFTPGDGIIVTGAGSGIGRQVALAAGAMGLRVVAWDIAEESAAATAGLIAEAGGRASAVAADISDERAVDAGMEAAFADLRPRYLVNNAGPPSSRSMPFIDGITMAAGGTHRVASKWLARERPSGSAMVNVVSVAGNVIGSSNEWYSASKAAITGYTRHLAAYHVGSARVNALAPGITDTPRLKDLSKSDLGNRIINRVPMRRMGQPDELAWPILFLLSPLASYINGALLVVDGGWTVTE